MLKFAVSKSNLTSKVLLVASARASKGTSNLLQCVLFKPVNGGIQAYATDFQGSLRAVLNVGEYEGNEAFAVDGDLLTEIIKNLSDEEVLFEYNKGKLIVKNGKAKYSLATVSDIENFPVIEHENGIQFAVETSILAEMLGKVVFCASTDSSMRALNGIFWEAHNGVLRLVASDGYRLALAEQKLSMNTEFEFITNLRNTYEIQRVLATTSEPEVKITYSYSSVSFNVGDFVATVRTVEENFPDYKRVLPKTFKTTLILNTDEVFEALKRVAVIAKRGDSKVKLAIVNDTLELSCQAYDFGEVIEMISVEKQGDDITIYFKPKFLMDALSHINEPKAEFSLIDPLAPALLKPKTDDNYKYIVLPVRA